MKFLGMVLRNARRNPIRTFLTIASLGVSLALAMVLVSYSTVIADANRTVRGYNRVVVMSAQGLGQRVPYACLTKVGAMEGVVAATPFSWFGGKYNEEVMPFAQFGVDPGNFFEIYDELTISKQQLEDWRNDRAGCVIGRKLAEERKIKVGDPFALKDGAYPFNLDMTVRGIYDGPNNRDLRACYFNWDFFNEGLKKISDSEADNAGVIIVRCRDGSRMASIARQVDESYANSDAPTRTQSEEAFGEMFVEMIGDFQWIILSIGLAVGVSLLCVTGNAMAMALRERTTEVAVLKAIGYGKSLVVALVLGESVLIAGVGGLLGAIGVKLLCDVVDLSRYSFGMLPFFFVPWSTALGGLAVAIGIGLFSGLVPAVRASRLSVVDGLRKVV